MLGACQKNTSQTANDTANTWTYKSDSLHTVYGHYYGEGNFVVEIPNSSTADAAALPDNYHSINTPAVAKLLVALGGVLSPQMT